MVRVTHPFVRSDVLLVYGWVVLFSPGCLVNSHNERDWPTNWLTDLQQLVSSSMLLLRRIRRNSSCTSLSNNRS